MKLKIALIIVAALVAALFAHGDRERDAAPVAPVGARLVDILSLTLRPNAACKRVAPRASSRLATEECVP